jgi:CheY-like chemotaxis protein
MNKSHKILVVDDEPVGRQLLEAILYPEGYEIIFAEDGLKALKSIIDNIPDLVLLDVMMPKMDGFEVCKKVRELPEVAHIPIFLITALDDRDSKIRGIDAGADDYISKPFDRVEILAKIKNRTTLFQYRQKHESEEEKKEDSIKDSYNNQLIRCLTDLILEPAHQSQSNRLEIYRSIPFYNSRYSVIINETPEGLYCSLISNNLVGKDGTIGNSIIASLLTKFCTEKKKSPTLLVNRIVDKLNECGEEYKIPILKNCLESMIVIYLDNNNKNIIASGINQSVYYIDKNSLVKKDPLNITYQSYTLSGNQNLEVSDYENIFVFSPNIPDSTNQQDLVSFLDKYFPLGLENDFSSIMSEKYNQEIDTVVVKLSN